MNVSIQSFFIPLIIFLLPVISMFSGLATVPLLILLAVPCLYILFKNRPNVKSQYVLFFAPLIGLLLWMIISVTWADNVDRAIILWLKLVSLVMVSVVVILTFSCFNSGLQRHLQKIFTYAVCFAVGFTMYEIATLGNISQFTRGIIGKNSVFHMHHLNRGACVMALLAFPFLLNVSRILAVDRGKSAVIAALIALWIVFFGVLYQLESLSALLGYVAVTCTFMYVFLLKARLYSLLTVAVIAVPFMTIFMAKNMDSTAVVSEYKDLPESAIHRLYIWDFAAEKASQKLFAGHGFAASRSIPGGEEKVVHNGVVVEKWQKMPLHPHNSVLQIWLELGLVGVFLYTVIMASILHIIGRSSLGIEKKALASSVAVGYFVISLTAFGVWQPWWWAAAAFSALFVRIAIATPAHQAQKIAGKT